MLKKIWQCLFCWSLPQASDKELAEADVILAHELGDQQTVTAATMAVSNQVCDLYWAHNKPVIAQFPVNVAIPEIPAMVISRNLRDSNKYLDTEEVQRQAATICELHRWNKVILCTHWAHAWRASENLKRHGVIPLYVEDKRIRFYWSTPRKSQKLLVIFLLRELGARFLYLFKGLI